MTREKISLGITHGDINGIGYEVIIKTLLDSRIHDICIPVVYGSPKVAAYHRKALNIQNFSFNNIRSAEEAVDKRSNIINVVDDEIRVELGKPTEIAGEGAFRALEAATADLKAGKIDVLVTAPIHKFTIHSQSFPFPGHTEYLESLFGTQSMMIMVSDIMRIGLLTGHVPLSEVPGLVTIDSLLEKLRILNQSMLTDFMIRRPRIAVLGLNPHSGDEGLFGQEEKEHIIPAIEKAREENMMVFGPFPADGFFGAGTFRKFDAVLAMYHDQGLSPFKAVSFGQGVNFTAGLSVVRTSPAHGTAHEIAGQDLASPDSFRNAIYLACDVFRNRQLHHELTSNPLSDIRPQDEGSDQGE